MEEENNNIKIFHEEDLKRIRKNRLKEEIHQLNKEPLSRLDFPSGILTFNYNIIIENLNSLISEMDEELSTDASKEILNSKTLIEMGLKYKPPHKIIRRSNNKQKVVFLPQHWLGFKILLFNHQNLIFNWDTKLSANVIKKIKQEES